MNYFEFFNGAKINCGDSALATIQDEFNFLGAKKPLVLSTAKLSAIGITDKVLSAFDGGKIKATSNFFAVPEIFNLDTVKELVALYKKNKCDSILAIGANSVFDTAKLLKLFLCKNCEDLASLSGDLLSVSGVKVPFIAVPTEFGSGSESSSFVEYGAFYANSRELIADAVIIDSAVATTSANRNIASAGMFALANACEAFLGLKNNEIALLYAKTAVKLIAENLVDAIKNGENSTASKNVLLGSALAGVAYSNAPFGACHALSEAMFETSGVPRYEVASILLPSCLAFQDLQENRLSDLLPFLCSTEDYLNLNETERADIALAKIRDIAYALNMLCGLPLKLANTAVQRESYGEIAISASNKRSAITAQKVLDANDFIAILNMAY